jgi:hypothetical protein
MFDYFPPEDGGELARHIVGFLVGMATYVASFCLIAGKSHPAFVERDEAQPTCCRCGYNLTGNVSGICPECGRKVRENSECRIANSE